MPRSAGRIFVEAANGSVSDGSEVSAGIDGDAENRTVREHRVATGNVNPDSLISNTGSKVEAELNIAVVGPNDSDALLLGRVLYLVDEGTVTKRSLSEVRGSRAVGDVPGNGAVRVSGVASDGFPYASGSR